MTRPYQVGNKPAREVGPPAQDRLEQPQVSDDRELLVSVFSKAIKMVERERDALVAALTAALAGERFEYAGPCIGGDCDGDPVTWCAIHDAARSDR